MALKRTPWRPNRKPMKRGTELSRGAELNKVSPQRQAEFDAAGIRPYSTLTSANRERVPAQREAQNRQQRRSRPTYTGPSKATIARLEIRCGGWCEFPGCRRHAQDPHHRDERGAGGRGIKAPAWINKLANLLAACRRHNDWASNGSPAEAREMGWLIEMGKATPYTVPVLTRHHPAKVLLDDEGGWTPVGQVAA